MKIDRYILGFLALIVVGVFLLGSAYLRDTQGPCPPGTLYQTTSLLVYCGTPTRDRVVCDLSAFRIPVTENKGPDGPWCPKAHNWKNGA